MVISSYRCILGNFKVLLYFSKQTDEAVQQIKFVLEHAPRPHAEYLSGFVAVFE
jgi:hypothetical protein